MERQSLSWYIDANEEELLRATKTENVLNGWNGETDIQLKHRVRQEHKEEMDGETAPRTIYEAK